MTNNLLTKDNTGIDDWYEVYPNIMHINLFIRNVDKEIDYLTGTEKSFYLGQAYGFACILLFLSLSNIWWCAVRDGTESYRG